MQGITLGPGSARALSTLVLRGRAAGRAAPLLRPARFTARPPSHDRHSPRPSATQESDRSCRVRPIALSGILAAVTTPFTADAEAVDEDALAAQAEWLIASGIHGLVPTGTTGEFMALPPRSTDGSSSSTSRPRPIAYPSSPASAPCRPPTPIDLAQHAERVGADAVMVVPPFYDPLDFATLTTFLTAVAESISLPIVYYNVPGATGIRLTADQIAELGEIDGVDYLKDTSGDAVTLADLLVSRTDQHQGLQRLGHPDVLRHRPSEPRPRSGAPPASFRSWPSSCGRPLADKGDLAAARELWRRLWAISDFLESVNYVAGVKAALDLIGHPAGPPRPPIQPLSAEQRATFAALLERSGVAGRLWH